MNRFMEYVGQHKHIGSDGVERHIENTDIHYTTACTWYDHLKPDIADPFYISCSASGCSLHVDHSESTGWPCVLVVKLEDTYDPTLHIQVVTKVVQMKKYLFMHMLSKEHALNMRMTDSAMSLSCPCGPYAGFVGVVHSRHLGTFEGFVISTALASQTESNTKRIQDRVYEWHILCDTDAISDLKNMPKV